MEGWGLSGEEFGMSQFEPQAAVCLVSLSNHPLPFALATIISLVLDHLIDFSPSGLFS